MARKKTPLEITRALGNPGKRALPEDTPRPRPSVPRCPAFVSKEARREWRRIAKELARMGLLSEVDRAALTGYCVAWGRLAEAEAKLRDEKQPLVLVALGSGYPIQNPWVAIANKAMEQLIKFGSEFGMSPSSRAGLRIGAGVVPPDPGRPMSERDKLAAFMSGADIGRPDDYKKEMH